MKKNIFSKCLLGALGLGLLASCSNDLTPDEPILENESTTFVRLSLVGEGVGSRADEDEDDDENKKYENGSGDESAVKSILLTFFDSARNYVGRTTVEVNEDASQVTVPGQDNTVERFLTVVAPVTLPENINYPKYVIAYVNPTSASGDLALDKVEDVNKIIRRQSEVSPNGYRTMNNSVYYNESTGYTRFATEVDFTKQFFEKKEDAEKADASATINITVERMEAKVRLNTALDAINVSEVESVDGNDTQVKYKLTFIPEAWFVNGTEKRSFLIKNYRTTRENYLLSGNATFPATDYGMTFTALQDAFRVNNTGDNRHNDFNKQEYKRSFWAIDPTYFIENTTDDLYPDVSYDVRYVWGNNTINDTDGKLYPLQYRSYANVLDEWNNHMSTSYVKYNGTAKSHEYVLENTMSYLTLNSPDAKASMTSVVLLGRYVIKNSSGQVVFDGSTTDKTKNFYIRHNAGEHSTNIMLSDKEAIDFFLERGGSTLYIASNDDKGNTTYEPLRAGHLGDDRFPVSYDDFEIVYPQNSVTNGTKQSEQWRTIQLSKKGKNNANLLIYSADADNGAGGYVSITATSVDMNSRMYAAYGVIEKFQTGKAYFNVPLKHIWGATKSGAFEAKNVVLGDYGVVRNHIYELDINSIKGLGTGIGNVDQPIVPPTENDQYYISTRLNILKWRLVKQSVDL